MEERLVRNSAIMFWSGQAPLIFITFWKILINERITVFLNKMLVTVQALTEVVQFNERQNLYYYKTWNL